MSHVELYNLPPINLYLFLANWMSVAFDRKLAYGLISYIPWVTIFGLKLVNRYWIRESFAQINTACIAKLKSGHCRWIIIARFCVNVGGCNGFGSCVGLWMKNITTIAR